MAHNYLQRVALAGSQSSTAARPPPGAPPLLPAQRRLPPDGTIVPGVAATPLAGPPVAPRPGMTTAPVASPSYGPRSDRPGAHEAPAREGVSPRVPDKSEIDGRPPPQVRVQQPAAHELLPGATGASDVAHAAAVPAPGPSEAAPAPKPMPALPLERERTIIQAPASWRAAAKSARPAVPPPAPHAHSHSDTAELAAHAPGAQEGQGAVGAAAPNVVGAAAEAPPLRPARSHRMLGYSDPTVIPPVAARSATAASAETAPIAPASPAGPMMPPNPVANAWRQPRITIGRIEVEVHNEAPPTSEAAPPKSPAPAAGLSVFDSLYLTRFALRPA
jgi:hypothetical protein